MINREIPFRPRLEGDFRVRFYNAASRISVDTPLTEIERIAEAEIDWVTKDCAFNLDQRKKYRAVWYLFRDLIHASWTAFYRDGVLYMSLPSLNGVALHNSSAPEVKQLLRSWMSESRHERLVSVSDFIRHMETANASGHTVAELIADGGELATRLERANSGQLSLNEAVRPYLQLVSENERDEYTGLKLAEIWRYFRLTWATPAETTPGRTMQYLIRDAAHPMHAVMGIASLENCAVQITCRDDFIGWNQNAFIKRITELPSQEARDELQRLLSYIEDGISGIDYSEICTDKTIREPNDEDIHMLLNYAANAEQQRQDWIGFAPYTKNELRICSIDAPDLTGIIRQVKAFMDKSDCQKVVFDVYLTRGQNGNTELSKLDYSGKDYEIGEYLRSGTIAISIKNVASAGVVKQELDRKPVHVAFYFDQSAYAIEFGPNSQNLYINPLVITYDYSFDEIQHKGSIYPSSEMDSGLIGDYHKLMKSADVISNNMNPHTTYNGSADMTEVVSTIKDRQVQWLVAADRDTNNYQPERAIPIGEIQYDKRMVNAWASSDSRIIAQYITLLRGYNLYPKESTLIKLLKQFGHISSNGLISIPKFGSDAQAIENKKKGLLGTLFAASWYSKLYENALVASLDDDKARLWLQNSKYGNERADLIGLYYDDKKDTLYIQPIEVKTRDESSDTRIEKEEGSNTLLITGHAADQVASITEMLKEIFSADEENADMFTAARREVLKYQIVTECFRNVHDVAWQKKWYGILKRAFENSKSRTINIDVSAIILHIKLNETTGAQHLLCRNPEFEDSKIDFWRLTATEIQRDVLEEMAPVTPAPVIDYDDTNDNAPDDETVDMLHAGNVLPEPRIIELTAPASGSIVPSQPKPSAEKGAAIRHNADVKSATEATPSVSDEEIAQLVKDFMRSCNDYNVNLKECLAKNAVVGPSVIRLKFRLARGQALQGLLSHLEDIGREMKRSGVIVQQVPNSDELLLDVPRLQREKVLFRDVIEKLPPITSPEQLYFPLGRTPNGKDLIEDLGQMPHMLVGGSTGSGKSVFLFTMLAAMLMTHPRAKDMQLVLSSSKLEDFIHFEGLPHLYNGGIISDALEATEVIKNVIFEESERRGRLLAEARVANIVEYNKKSTEKLAPIVVVIDEFADLSDQLETKKEKDAFFKPVQRIAQAGRSRGIHLVICTQRPEAKLVPSTTKAQLNGRVALRVNDGISSRMIIEGPEAQYLQKHGDMIYRDSDTKERAQGYLIEIPELDEIVRNVIEQNK